VSCFQDAISAASVPIEHYKTGFGFCNVDFFGEEAKPIYQCPLSQNQITQVASSKALQY
jgi:hypothetical protein